MFDDSAESPIYLGAGSRIRTDDLLITNQLLYQLSYAGVPIRKLFSAVDQEFVMNYFAHRAAKAIKISRNFSTAREMV